MMASLSSSPVWMLHGIYTVICVGFIVLVMTGGTTAQCNDTQCAMISSTISFTVAESNVTDKCLDNGTTITISCNRGFQNLVAEYTATCNGETEKFEENDSCELDLLTLFVAIVSMLVVVFVFVLLVFLVWKRYTKKRKKAMYDSSRDISEIIDGHDEEGGVDNVAMNTMPPSLIPIELEDPYETQNEVGTQTTVEVHYANSSAALKNEARSAEIRNGDVQYANNSSATMGEEDTIGGYGTINENGMLPIDPQAGNSTDKLISAEHDGPDEEGSALNPYASIGDWPLKRVRRGPSDASQGGSVRVRPVTAPPAFTDKSASVRVLGSKDGIPTEALYAKINKVKRASDRWPPGGKDPTRLHGRPADMNDLLHQIDKPGHSPAPKNENLSNRPAEESKVAESLYAEVPEESPSGSDEAIPPPTAPKPARNSRKVSDRRPIKRYVPPSRLQSGSSENAAMYTEVDRSRPASSQNLLISSTFAPPSPPLINGTEGMYAQIDHNRKSRKNAAQGDHDSHSTDEGFVDHTTKL